MLLSDVGLQKGIAAKPLARSTASLAIVSFLWGSAWIADEAIGRSTPPLRVLALRYAIAALVLLPAAVQMLRGKRTEHQRGRYRWKELAASALLGLTLFAGPDLLLLASATHGAGNWTPLLYAALPVGLSIATGQLSTPALMGLGAVAVLLNGAWPLGPRALLWAAPAALGVWLQGWSLLALRRTALLRSDPSLLLQCVVASVALFVVAAVSRTQFVLPGTAALFATALLGVFATALPYLLYYGVLNHLEPMQAASTEWLQLLVSLAESAWFLDRRPSIPMVLAATVLLGATVALLRSRPQVTGFSLFER